MLGLFVHQHRLDLPSTRCRALLGLLPRRRTGRDAATWRFTARTAHPAADLQRGSRAGHRRRRGDAARRRGGRRRATASISSCSATPTSADVWLDEQALVDAARARLGLDDRLFYRHRSRQPRRKVGNIADWVERWGGAYPFMLVLDADSLMEADTILELARRHRGGRDPQASCRPSPTLIGGRTPLARLQQFAGRVYGPLLVARPARWFGDAGNYWGHNAIMRTEAFAGCAGPARAAGRASRSAGSSSATISSRPRLLRRGGYAVLHGRRPRRQLRARAAEPDRAGRARPPLVRRATSSISRCCGIAGAASAEPPAPGERRARLSRLAALAAVPARGHVAGALRQPRAAGLLPRTAGRCSRPGRRSTPQRAITLFGLCLLMLYDAEAARPRHLPRASRASRGQRLRAVAGLPGRSAALGADRADPDADADARGRADPARPRQRLERAGPRRRRLPWSTALALSPPARSRRRRARDRRRRDLLVAAGLDEPGARQHADRRAARRLPRLGRRGRLHDAPADHVDARGPRPAPDRTRNRRRDRGACAGRRRRRAISTRCCAIRPRSRGTWPGSTA